MRQDREDVRQSHIKVVFMGLVMNLLIPGILVAAGVALRNVMGSGDTHQIMGSVQLQTLFNALMFVSLSQVPIIFILKKKILKPLSEASGSDPANVPTLSQILSRYTILYMISMSSSVYGFIYYMLGGQFEFFILFALISLLTFRLIRPSAAFYYSLFGERSDDRPGL